MHPAEKEKLDMLARMQQMKINTRLTALQTALSLMATNGYTGIPGAVEGGDTAWIKRPGSVDHVTLLAIASDVEKYILGEIEQETSDALAAADRPRPSIVPAKDMPAGLRP